jgi:hypothetical protein
MSEPRTRRGAIAAGAFCSAAGVLLAVLIRAQTEGLRVPAVVGDAAAAAFALAGMSIIAMQAHDTRMHAWLIVVLLCAMTVPAAWVAFGPGERVCAGSFGPFALGSPALTCRSAFCVGALILIAVLAIAIRLARAAKNES